MTIRVSHTLLSTYLVSGTPTSAVSSLDILAVLRPDEPDERVRLDETLFAKLGVLRSVALKVKESAANEHLAISRPARDAREVLKEMVAGGEESLGDVLSGYNRVRPNSVVDEQRGCDPFRWRLRLGGSPSWKIYCHQG